VKSTFWPHSIDPYILYTEVSQDPRIPIIHIARKLNVNPKTAEVWWRNAVEKKIIIPPIFRRKSFLNFREHFYFIRTKDPHESFQRLKSMEDIMYCTVQTGFADMQVVSRAPLTLREDVVLKGQRSDYYVTTPKNHTFEKASRAIDEKLKTIDEMEFLPSPLIFRKEDYSPWDDLDEAIYLSLNGNLRKPWAHVLKESGAYNDKIMKWFRRRDKFGHTITMYFPEGERAYQSSVFALETQHDRLIIDLFSELPSSSVFYRLDKYLIMTLYVSFPLIAKSMVRRVLSCLQKKELMGEYINSIIEYYYRED
jgi:hypothetical protein